MLSNVSVCTQLIFLFCFAFAGSGQITFHRYIFSQKHHFCTKLCPSGCGWVTAKYSQSKFRHLQEKDHSLLWGLKHTTTYILTDSLRAAWKRPSMFCVHLEPPSLNREGGPQHQTSSSLLPTVVIKYVGLFIHSSQNRIRSDERQNILKMRRTGPVASV